jgi:general secretion pathway protein A
VYRRSGGTPRLINAICDRALLGAYTSEQAVVAPKLVREAATEVCGEPARHAHWLQPAVAGAGIAAVALLVALGLWRSDPDDPEAAAPRETLPSATVEAVVPAATAAGTQPQGSTAAPELPAAPATDSTASAGLGDWLRDSSGATGTDAAFATLLELWHVAPTAAGAQPCRHAAGQGLRCEHQLGSWALLRSLDRPAILDLVDARGDAHQVVLAGLDGDEATLRVGAQTRAFSSAEIDRYWFGEFLILWRPDARANDLMLPGMRSEGVRWLRETLAGLQGGGDASRDPALYDDVLTERVRAFQRERGLRADGKVGLRTLIALDTALGRSDTPLLRSGG